jgi:hypothetical protein
MLPFIEKVFGSYGANIAPKDYLPRTLLTPSMVCREFIRELSHKFEPGIFHLVEGEPALFKDMLRRTVEFEMGNRSLSLDDYSEYYMMPHVLGLAALLRMSGNHGYDVFQIPLPNGAIGARHQYDGISLLITEKGDKFRVEILFRPRTGHR